VPGVVGQHDQEAAQEEPTSRKSEDARIIDLLAAYLASGPGLGVRDADGSHARAPPQ
jgi:hypothetical protein